MINFLIIHGHLIPFWSCCDEPVTCLHDFFLSAGLFRRTAKKIDGSGCLGMCGACDFLQYMSLSCLIHMDKRKKLRKKYGLKETPCGDCLTTVFFAPCTLIQEK